jgi:phage FluMu gp28-like protein
MLFHVTERFRGGDPGPVYRRFREQGRMAPAGVEYVASWVTDDLTTCFQVMEAESRDALDVWIGRWADLVEFDVAEVVTSAEASERVR